MTDGTNRLAGRNAGFGFGFLTGGGGGITPCTFKCTEKFLLFLSNEKKENFKQRRTNNDKKKKCLLTSNFYDW